MRGTIESTQYTAFERRIDVQSSRQIVPLRTQILEGNISKPSTAALGGGIEAIYSRIGYYCAQ